MPSPGGDRVGPRIGLAAVSFLISVGQTGNESVVVTVPLHQTEVRPFSPPCVSVSADGRFVAFVSAARLAPEDTNDRDDVYVLDRQSGGVSFETAGVKVTGARPAISATGRFLVYQNGLDVLMIRDRLTGVVRALQRGREPPNGSSRGASISADGRYVAFASSATNLVDGPDPSGGGEDVYVADTTSMTFRRIAASSFAPAVSEDGRFVAFSSTAPSVGAADARKTRAIDTYVDDLQTGVTTRVSVSASGGPADGSSYGPSISGDGRYVAFVSEATNLVGRHDRNRVADIYVRDTIARTTELISRRPSGEAGNGPSRNPALSSDGRIVIFQSEASDLMCGDRCPLADRDINLVADIFRHDRSTGITEVISRSRTLWMEASMGPAADRTGTIVAFASRHPLDQADDRHDYDLFVWARELRR